MQDPDDFSQLFWKTWEEMWTAQDDDFAVATIDLPAEVHAILEVYAKERGMDPADLLMLAVGRGSMNAAISRWGKNVAALVDDSDLIDWPLDDPLSCLAIGFMCHIAIQSVKKWRERHGDDDDQADWWKAVKPE